MGGEAIVSFVVSKLGNLLIEEARLLYEVHDQFEWIERELKRMQCFLKDADAKQKNDERVRHWVAEVRDISYEAEDIIDTFIVKSAQNSKLQFVGLVKRYCCICLELIARHKTSTEIKRIEQRICEISTSTITYNIRDITEGGQQGASSSQELQDHRRYFALLEEPDIVGFEKDMDSLKQQLLDGEPRRAVISIVGMGGSGKTTLAKKIYHDIKKDFECHAFIYLSQKYNFKDILIRITKCIMSLSREEIEMSNEQDLGTKLSEYLNEKRYLVVIDDIWDREAWDRLKLTLPKGPNKSRVMLTTRNEDVALHADPTSHPHQICLLNDKESWELFLKNVFPGQNTCPTGLEEIGRQILSKCGCLPLAIVVLGGLLSRREATLAAWSRVLESVSWHLAESSNKIREILALSYYDLPHYLKPCFLYAGLFPEDIEIKSKRLIQLWIAEGFIQERGKEIMEDVAEDYLNELIGRSMIQVAKKRSNGSVSTCRIHDLLRDLSIFEAKQNNFFEIVGDDDTICLSTSKHRRLALCCSTGKYDDAIFHSTAVLRSVLCFQGYEFHLSKLFSKGGKLLRVLDVGDGYILEESLPKEVREFIHLRYLKFKGIALSPIFAASLSNLQTLEITSSVHLPNAIWDLERLRHLYAYHCEIEGQPRLTNLRNLQTLCLSSGSWINDGLDKLTGLRKLGISGDVASYSDLLSHSIDKLRNLQSLRIESRRSIPQFMSFAHHLHLYKMLLVGDIEKLLDLPPNLSKLTLWGSQLKQDDITKVKKLLHLRVLGLHIMWNHGEKWTFSPGDFPQLESLFMYCEDVKELTIEKGAMPRLKSWNFAGLELCLQYHISIQETEMIKGHKQIRQIKEEID